MASAQSAGPHGRGKSYCGDPQTITTILARHISKPGSLKYSTVMSSRTVREKLLPFGALFRELYELQPNLSFAQSTVEASLRLLAEQKGFCRKNPAGLDQFSSTIASRLRVMTRHVMQSFLKESQWATRMLQAKPTSSTARAMVISDSDAEAEGEAPAPAPAPGGASTEAEQEQQQQQQQEEDQQESEQQNSESESTQESSSDSESDVKSDHVTSMATQRSPEQSEAQPEPSSEQPEPAADSLESALEAAVAETLAEPSSELPEPSSEQPEAQAEPSSALMQAEPSSEQPEAQAEPSSEQPEPSSEQPEPS